METKTRSTKAQLITGWVLSGLAIAFLLFDSFGKFAKPEPVIEGTIDLGYPESILPTLGTLLLVSTVLYAVPRFSFFGAILLTGYLGGAVATHIRVDNPLFSHTLFPVYFGLLVWGGLYLRSIKFRSYIAS